MYLSSQLILISSTCLIFIGLNSCTSNNVENQYDIPRIWPNISSNNSFLQFPGLSGSGGLDFSFYDAFAKLTGGLPSFAQDGGFKLLQIALIVTVGGLLTGAAALLAEAHFFRLYYSDLFDGQGPAPYGAPLLTQYGAPSPPTGYGSPPSPPSTYGAPSPPSPPSTYGAPSPPSSTYGAPSPKTGYGPPPSPPSTYEAPSPPSSTYGAPSPPTGYGPPPSPPSTYGAPSPPSSTYGAPSPPSPPSTYGAPSPPTGYGPPPSPPSTYGAPSSPSSEYGVPAAF